MNEKVNTYLAEGCGRCPHYQTPQCKVHTWSQELIELRRIVLGTGLTEEYKWSQPCYTSDGANILIVTAFKNYACVSFFKGALLSDPSGILVSPGASSQAARQLRYVSASDVLDSESTIIKYIEQAIALEKTGSKIKFKKNPEPIPEELKSKFATFPDLERAFMSLTTGRQRGYILYFSQPKQSKTRTSRIEKYQDAILAGKGIHDDYKARKK